MANLTKAVGLLNEQAPENHFLAYINPREAGLLKNAGGSGRMTQHGIISFEDDYGWSGHSTGEVESNSGWNDSDWGTDMSSSPSTNTTTTWDDSGDDDKALSYVNWEQPTTPSSTSDNNDNEVGLLAKAVQMAKVPYDLLKGNVPISLLNLINPFDKPTNQYEGITGEDGIGEGDYISTIQDWQQANSELGLDPYDTLDQEGQALIDQEAFKANFRTQDFKDFYSGANTDTTNFTSSENDAHKQLMAYAPYVVGGTEAPQKSMVNDYFSNIGNQQGLSQGLLDNYATAKTNIANTLNTTNANQFGLNRNRFDPYKLGTSGNPFYIDYLINQGLI